MTGTIVKGIAGFYYVLAGEGEDRRVYECKARGIFRKDGITPLAGDRVSLSVLEDGSGSVDEILPRVNVFDRPPVANVETMILVAAPREPEPSFPLLDRFCVMAEQKNCRIAVCVNKADIGDPAILQRFRNVYGPVYPVFIISTKTGEGVEELRSFLKGTQAALAGPSGVGKSSIANVLLEDDAMETGEISRKTMRGRNTTRHTELFDAGDFRLFDTPGFTSFELSEVEEDQLQHYFPEFAPYLGKCRFDNCRHLDEPDCAVAKAAADKAISRRRYSSYKDMMKFLQQQEKY
ncbi:MAG: ribosome small subunit-dependent GTPase A [Firmicutes bacterium]|nr:ribosome small subunit-dependent GTPase A [Bacillota bacterium]